MESNQKPARRSKSGVKALITVFVILLLVGGGVYGYYRYKQTVDNRPKEYETVSVSRGTVERVIAGTGTLDPVGSVEVGTQVSGTVDKVLVDFNDTVKAGQIIAEIDKSVLVSKLTESQASLSRADALFVQSEQEFKRGEVLFEKGLISEQDFSRARTDYLSQRASLQVAKAAVTTASENVRYATIRSPVRGTVIKRAVDVGQTVAASLSAPTLFVIAEDLKKMKIMAQVDETDIGKIKTAQEVRFSVQAYPDKKYAGAVSQVRLQPEVVQSVVTYTVVILADNNDGTLLPGMTANVEFVEAREENALVVPMSALRFRPPQEVVEKFEREHREKTGDERGEFKKRIDEVGGPDAFFTSGDIDPQMKKRIEDAGGPEAFREKMKAERRASKTDGADQPIVAGGGERRRGGQGQDGAQGRDRQGQGGQGNRGAQGNQKRQSLTLGSRGILWTLDGNNEFNPVRVRVGLNDGVRVAVTGDALLSEGLKVVTGEVKSDKDNKAKSNDKNRSLLPQQQGPGGGPRRM